MPVDEVGYMFVGQPTLSEQALRALELKGDLPLQLVDPRLSLSLNVDDWTRPEYDYLRRTIRGAGSNTQPAVAGQFSSVSLGYISATPKDQAMICTVDRVILSNFTAAVVVVSISLAINSLAAYSFGQGVAFDSRVQKVGAGATQTRAAIGVGSNAVQRGGGGISVSLAANSSTFVDLGAVITSLEANVATMGGMLVVEGAAVNTQVSASFQFRERFAATSELS